MTNRSDACLNQITYWLSTIKAYQKALHRKNNHIRRLQSENERLLKQETKLMERIARLEL